MALCRLARRLNRRADRALREMRSPKAAACLVFCGVRRVWQKYRPGLLNRYTVISRIVGSNPIPSASLASRDILFRVPAARRKGAEWGHS
jgi:hypothetical protein